MDSAFSAFLYLAIDIARLRFGEPQAEIVLSHGSVGIVECPQPLS